MNLEAAAQRGIVLGGSEDGLMQRQAAGRSYHLLSNVNVPHELLQNPLIAQRVAGFLEIELGWNRNGYGVAMVRNPISDELQPVSLPMVWANSAYERPLQSPLCGPLHDVWARGLLVASGELSPAPVGDIGMLPSDNPKLQTAWSTIQSIFGARWLREYGAPAPLSRDFLWAWSGAGREQKPFGKELAYLLKKELEEIGLIRCVGWHGRAKLWTFGSGEWAAASSFQSAGSQ